ncbi:hypothetical protein FRC10_006720 [Ceratobasidium sp. 414]|nr:hypothetical protein FRC10_006720 [Ceratobasidium sp. 414]
MTRLNFPLFVALAVSILAAADARDTLPHQRMIRKRAPVAFSGHVAFALPRWEGLQERADLAPGGGNGNPDGNQGSSSSAAVSRTSSAASSTAESSTRAGTTIAETTSSAATSSAVTSSAQSSSLASSSTGTGLLASLTGLLSSTRTSTTVSSTSSVSSSSVAPGTSTSSIAPLTTQAAAQPNTPTPTLNLATTPAQATTAKPSVAVVTSIAPEAVASQQAEQKARTAKITKNTIISLVVIASCIGGAVAIWTVIRKWKLGPSQRFDDRMQPIDWAPTGGAGGVREETMEEKRHRRAGSAGSHGSFTSGGVGQSELGHGTGARSVYSDHAGHNMQPQDFPPAHDFTAGPGNYGQYYQGQQPGYADLQRGPSVTESSYSHGASVTRGLSYSRGGGGYEAQPVGAMPPLPNPYGGGYEYEDHGRQQAQGQYRAY